MLGLRGSMKTPGIGCTVHDWLDFDTTFTVAN
jgi:hypothetical protein